MPNGLSRCTLGLLLIAATALAQTPYERVSLETTIGVDLFRGDNVSDRPRSSSTSSAQLGDYWRSVRPWLRLRGRRRRRTHAPWTSRCRPACILNGLAPSPRNVDASYIASRSDSGCSTPTRSESTIAGHTSYFIPLLPFDAGGPRGTGDCVHYPLRRVRHALGRWDREPIVNSAPVRGHILGAPTSPRQTPVFEAGRRHPPTTGLRLGVSFAHGAYLAM
jgi:hypothetical protein